MIFSERRLLRFVLVPLTALLALPYSRGQKQDPAGSQAIQVQVEMVSLPVVVTTRDGRRVTDLQKEDFEVLEDKVPQQIAGFASTEEPVSVALLLDTSGSMHRKIGFVQDQAIRFVEQLHPDDAVAIISFADDVNLQQDFSLDRTRAAYGIRRTRAGGGTALYEAVWLALEDVLKPVNERKALVVFTDGVDTVSRRISKKGTLELAKESEAAIYSIYFDTEEDVYRRGAPGRIGGVHFPFPPIFMPPGPGASSADYAEARGYLSKLAEFSGGMYYDALRTEDLEGVFHELAQELASQYSIGYYPTNTRHDGKFRYVQVKVRQAGYTVRTKKGYFAPRGNGS